MIDQVAESVSKDLKENLFFKLNQNKVSYSENLKSPLVPNQRPGHVELYDSIKIDEFNKRPDEAEARKYKHLAIYDILIDQHIRATRPEDRFDDSFKYVSQRSKPSWSKINDFNNNVFFDEFFTFKNNFIIDQLKQEFKKINSGSPTIKTDPVTN